MVTSSKWKDRVDLKIYHLDEDDRPGEKSHHIPAGLVVINGRTRLTEITTDKFFRALEQESSQKSA